MLRLAAMTLACLALAACAASTTAAEIDIDADPAVRRETRALLVALFPDQDPRRAEHQRLRIPQETELPTTLHVAPAEEGERLSLVVQALAGQEEGSPVVSARLVLISFIEGETARYSVTLAEGSQILPIETGRRLEEP
jgi:hypothetical protein